MENDKQIILQVTEEQFDEWSRLAEKKGRKLEDYIEDCVEGHFIRSQVIKYLNEQASRKPWWEKRMYNL